MTEPFFALTRDPRLSPYATSAVAAWLWAADGSRVLWANASGAALLGAANPLALTEKSFLGHDLGAQIARTAADLPDAGTTRTGRLTGGNHNDALVGTCSRATFGETAAILIVADAPVQPVLPLAERVARMFGACSAPLAVFSGMGALLFASPQLADSLGAAATLAALDAGALMAQAITSGHAQGTSAIGPLAIERMGSGGATVLVATRNDRIMQESPANMPELEAEQQQIPSEYADFAAPVAATLADVGAALRTPPQPEPEAETRSETAAPAKRRFPLRFVWTMDADERFTLASRDFAEVAGPRTAALMGRPWREIAAALALDPEERVARAVESRDTWSGITVAWPVQGPDERIAVELSGLPIFDRDRAFRGYRGFGVCRDIARDKATTIAGEADKPADEAAPIAADPAIDARPLLTVVPAAKNVVPFRAAPTPEKRPALTPVERSAFREIGETLGSAAPERGSAAPERREQEEPRADVQPLPSAFATGLQVAPQAAAEAQARAVLERLPVAILIHHGEQLLYANRAFLEWTGYADIAALAADGGLERLVIAPGAPLDRINGTGKSFTIATRSGGELSCEGRLYTVPWEAHSALMLVLMRSVAEGRIESAEAALRAAEAEARELRQILDAAADGVIVTDREGRVLALNRAAEALFATRYAEIARRPFTELFAAESEHDARASLDALTANGAPTEGREVTGRTRAGKAIPLFLTMGRIGEGEKFCAVLRDISTWKRAEHDLVNAKRNAEHASSAKSDFLAKISHEIRTPLNAIIGFSEVMMEERFGPVGNERYREYLNDIHVSGGHLVSLVNDLLDLSKIEAGKLDLVFASVNLNPLVAQCVALMQPQANQQRIIIRTSLPASLPAVTADARAVRQIVLNLLSNAITFAGAGGQVIVSTAASGREVALRVRDTGAGMTAKEIETALEPFRQLATSTRAGSGGTGLGLPLTKALAEANRARFSIESQKDAGTLVEVVFGG
jgi:PAS domain S-box-containing protein